MNLTGTRTTLIANVCALVVASVVALEGAYIVYQRFGVFKPTDVVASFVPALAMLTIRNRTFSLWFLFFYFIVAIELLFRVRSVYSGVYNNPGEKYPLQAVGLFFIFSLGCLAIYAAGVLVRMLIRAFRPDK